MDRIKPIDIERTNLKIGFRGYERSQVDALLQQAADEMAALLTQLDSMQVDADKLKADVESYRAQESTLKETLIIASKAAEETRSNAHREAELIIQDAKQKAQDAAKEAKAALADVKFEIERLKLDKQRFINGFRTLLEGHLRELAESTRGLSLVETEVRTGSENAANA